MCVPMILGVDLEILVHQEYHGVVVTSIVSISGNNDSDR